MISRLRNLLRRQWLSAMTGTITGIAGGIVWITWFVNFAPLADEASSAWFTSVVLPLDERTPVSFYKPRFDDLLLRVRLHGRVGGSAWQSIREATDAWLLADPVGCLNHLIESGTTGLIDNALLSDALHRATGDNFAVAVARADEIADGRVRNRWIRCAFLQQAKDDPESAFVALRSVPRQMTDQLSWILIQEWTSKDAAKAFQTFYENGDRLLSSAAAAWAAHDPDAAYAFVSNSTSPVRLQDGQTITPATLRFWVMNSIAQNYPEKAVEFAKGLQGGAPRSAYLRNALTKIAEEDPERALALVDGLPGDLLRLQMRRTVAEAAVQKGVALAEDLGQALPGERARSAVATAGLWRGGYEDCAGAAKKAVAIKDPIARSDAMHSTAGVWLQKKPFEAITFAVAESSQSGDATWLRVLADAIVDQSERWPMQPVLASATVNKLSEESRAQLRAEIAKRPASKALDEFLRALK